MNDRLGAPDLKQNLIRIINECVYSSHLLSISLCFCLSSLCSLRARVCRLLEPVREHFKIPENAALLERVRSYRTTR